MNKHVNDWIMILLQISDVQEDYEIVSKEDCRPDELAGDRLQMYSRLEKDLLEQYKLCKENREACLYDVRKYLNPILISHCHK